MQQKILVVDDDPEIALVMKNSLEKVGFFVDMARSADEAQSYDLPSYSLLVIDVLMERVTGFDFAKRLKNNSDTENIPFIFCTELGNEEDRVLGLNLGADDYIVKPFFVGEFVARVRSVLRRSMITFDINQKVRNGSFEPSIIMRDLRIDRNKKTAFMSGKDLNLTKTEYQLLLYLSVNRNIVHSRQSLLDKLWHKDSTSCRAIDTNITRLRKKLGEYGRCIITRPGYGYGFREL